MPKTCMHAIPLTGEFVALIFRSAAHKHWQKPALGLPVFRAMFTSIFLLHFFLHFHSFYFLFSLALFISFNILFTCSCSTSPAILLPSFSGNACYSFNIHESVYLEIADKLLLDTILQTPRFIERTIHPHTHTVRTKNIILHDWERGERREIRQIHKMRIDYLLLVLCYCWVAKYRGSSCTACIAWAKRNSPCEPKQPATFRCKAAVIQATMPELNRAIGILDGLSNSSSSNSSIVSDEKLKMKRKTIHSCVIVYSCMPSTYDDVLRKLCSHLLLFLPIFLSFFYFGSSVRVDILRTANGVGWSNELNLLFIAQHNSPNFLTRFRS